MKEKRIVTEKEKRDKIRNAFPERHKIDIEKEKMRERKEIYKYFKEKELETYNPIKNNLVFDLNFEVET